MKKEFKKIKKGLFALFLFNLVLVSNVSLIQSCTENEDLIKEKKFDKTLENSLNKISKIKITNINKSLSKSSSNLNYIYVLASEINKDYNLNESNKIGDFNNLLDVSMENDLILSESPDSNLELVETFTMDENLVKEALNPSIAEAKNIIRSNGITDDEINQFLLESGASEEDLVPVVMLVNSIDKGSLAKSQTNSSLFINSVYAQQDFDWDKARTCAIAALGLNVWDIVRGASVQGFKAAFKVALKAIGPRFLGPIGVAITVAEWGICYNSF